MKTTSQSQPGPTSPHRDSSVAVYFRVPAQRAKENSPALECWVRAGEEPSPGRDERNFAPTPLSSLTGLSDSTTANPALKCWAIFGRSCGTPPTQSSRCDNRSFANWSFLRLLAGFVVLGILSSRATAEIYEVRGTKIEVSLLFEKPAVILGEPTWFTFRVHNHSVKALEVIVGGDYQNEVGRPNSFKITAVGNDGVQVPQPSVRMNRGGTTGPQRLPPNGNYDFKLFMPHWATFEKPGRYVVTCGRKLNVIKAGTFFSSDTNGFHVEVQTTGNIEILPTNDKVIGANIEALGRQLREGTWDEKERGAQSLAGMEDQRVIPHFRRVLNTGNYTLMYIALGSFGRFRSDDALQGLKDGLALAGADVKNCTTTAVATVLAGNLRLAAAASLARSPHPDAIPFLLKNRNDPSEGVRITILHVLGRMTTPDSLAILQEMTKDKSEIVSKEAKRYFELRTKPNSL